MIDGAEILKNINVYKTNDKYVVVLETNDGERRRFAKVIQIWNTGEAE